MKTSPLLNRAFTIVRAMSALASRALDLPIAGKSLRGLSACSVLVAGTSLFTTSAWGGDFVAPSYWNGSASTSWNTTANWSASATGGVGAVPVASSNVFFSTTAPVATNLGTLLTRNFTINSLTYLSTAATTSIGGGGANTLTIGSGGITVAETASTHLITADVILGTSQTWTIGSTSGASSTVFKVSGGISGGFSLTSRGGGTLNLTGANTFSGNMFVNGGTLLVNGGGSITGVANAGAAGVYAGYTAGSTGIITVDGAGSTVKAGAGDVASIGFAGTGTLNVTNGGSFQSVSPQLGHEIGATGTLNVATGGTVTVSGMIVGNGNGQGAGATGTLNVLAGGTVAAGSGQIYLTNLNPNSTGTLNIGAFASGTTAGTLTAGTVFGGAGTAVVNLNQTDSITFTPAITGSASVNQRGTGTTVLTGANTYLGNTTITSGTLQIGNGTTGSIATTSVVSTAASSTLALNLATGGTFANDVANAGTVETRQGASTNNVISGVISGNGGLLQSGGGNAILTGANTYQGITTLSAGSLTIGNNGTTGSLGTGDVHNNAQLVFDRTNDFTVANNISGSGGVVKANSNTTYLTGTNSYGITTINSGSLDVGSGGTTGTLGTGAVTVTNANIEFNHSDTITVPNNIGGSNGSVNQVGTGKTIITGTLSNTGNTFISSGILQIGAGSTIGSLSASSPVINNSTLAFNRSNAMTVSNGISGTGSVEQNGTGTTTLTGVGTYSGDTNVNNGVLEIKTGANNMYNGGTTAGKVNVNGASTLLLSSTDAFGQSNTALNVVVTVNAGSTVKNNSSYIPLRNMVFNGGNLVTNTGVNAAFQSFGLEGTVTIGGTSATRFSTVGSGTFDGINIGREGVAATTTFDVANATGNSSADLIVSVAIADMGGQTSSLTKTGSGTMQVSGINTYTGATSVFDGTFLVSDGKIDQTQSIFVGGKGEPGATMIVSGSNGRVTTSDFSVGQGTLDIVNGGTVRVAANLEQSVNHVASTPGTRAFAPGILTLGSDEESTGTLNIGTGGAPGTLIAAEVTSGDGDGVVNFNHSAGAYTFSPNITGDITVNQIGSGTTILIGNSTYTGNTNISNGALLVNGSIGGHPDRPAALATSPTPAVLPPGVYVSGNGTLGGTGTINFDVFNSGNVAPGGLNSPGTLHINGNYSQTSSGALTIRIESSTSFDVLAITGTAALAGDLRVKPGNGNSVQPGDTFKILTATSGVTGTFGKADLGTLVSLKVIYEPNDVILKAGQLPVSTITDIEGVTPNQIAVANSLDNGLFDPRLAKVIAYLDTFNISLVPPLLDQIAPEELAALYNMAISHADVEIFSLQQRFQDLRFVDDSSPGQGDVGEAQHHEQAKATIAPGAKQPSQMMPNEDHYGYFISATGDFASVGDTFNANGFNLRSAGTTLGLDTRIGDHSILGLTLGYARTDTDLIDDGRLRADGGKAALYGMYHKGGFFTEGLVGGGYNSFDTKRGGLGGPVFGSTNGGEFDAYYGIGYDVKFDNHLMLTPLASVAYTSVGIDGFDEHGSLAPLHINSQDESSLRSRIGLRAACSFKQGDYTITPSLTVQWQHEFQDNAYPIDASFANGAGSLFTVHGPEFGRDSALLTAAVNVQWGAFAFYLAYQGNFGSNFDNQSVLIGVRKSF